MTENMLRFKSVRFQPQCLFFGVKGLTTAYTTLNTMCQSQVSIEYLPNSCGTMWWRVRRTGKSLSLRSRTITNPISGEVFSHSMSACCMSHFQHTVQLMQQSTHQHKRRRISNDISSIAALTKRHEDHSGTETEPGPKAINESSDKMWRGQSRLMVGQEVLFIQLK